MGDVLFRRQSQDASWPEALPQLRCAPSLTPRMPIPSGGLLELARLTASLLSLAAGFAECGSEVGRQNEKIGEIDDAIATEVSHSDSLEVR